MPERDPTLALPADIAAALGLLTRLPVPVDGATAEARGADAAWAYPAVGLVVGLLAVTTGQAAIWIGLGPGIVAGLILATTVIVTGALHEDGLADTCDGLWGGSDPTRRLEIMKDSQIGSYGVLALILSLGLRWTALGALIAGGSFAAAVVAAAVLSRVPMVALMHALPHARADGLSHCVGHPSRATVALAGVLALLFGLILIGATVIPVAVVLILTGLAAAAIARAKIGGQTGDILGATQQLAEIAVLLSLVALTP